MAGVLLRTRSLRYNSAGLSGGRSTAINLKADGKSLRYNSAALVGAADNAINFKLRLSKDMVYGGMYSISGIIKEDGIPSINRIILMDRRSWCIVRSCVSGSDGTYHFYNLNSVTAFILLAVDDDNVWNAKAFDFVMAT